MVLQGATLIDGTSTFPKTDTVITIHNNEIIAVTNQTNYQYNSFNDSNRSPTNERVLNLTGKYIMPRLFDTHAHVAGVLKDSYDQITSEKTLGMLLDYGITTIRNPGGSTNESVSLKEKVLNESFYSPILIQ